MKAFPSRILAVLLLACSPALASDVSSPAGEYDGWQVLASEKLDSSPSNRWRLSHGDWKIADGAWQASERESDKHAAVARLPLEFHDGVIGFDFKFDGAKMVSVSINDAKAHLCRVQITPDRLRVMKDDHDGPKGPDKAQVLQEKKLSLKPGTWYTIKMRFNGPELSADVGGVKADGRNPQVALQKANIGLVVAGASASFRNLRVLAPPK